MRLKKIISTIRKRLEDMGLLSKGTFDQFKKFIVTGFTSFGAEALLIYILTEFAGAKAVISNTIAIIIVFWFNFFINRIWSFKSKKKVTRQVILYGILFMLNLAISDVIMYIFTDILGIYYLIPKVFATGMIFLWNFVLYKKVIYK